MLFYAARKTNSPQINFLVATEVVLAEVNSVFFPTQISKIVGKVRQIRLCLSQAEGLFDPIKVGKIPTILPNKVGHLDLDPGP